MDVRFNQLEALHWLWGTGALVTVLLISLRLKRRALERLAVPRLIPRLTGSVSQIRPIVRVFCVGVALVFLVGAMIDPRWGVRYERVQQRGIDVVVVLDVSRSMLAEDVRPNRLERSRRYIADLVAQLGGDRVGLVTFAGHAAVRCPLTVDYGAFRLLLDTVQPQDAGRGGSLLGDALRVAVEAFTDDVSDHKAIILFSDGEDHDSYPLEAARRIGEEHGIPIFTVALGDAQTGARIPVNIGGKRIYLTHDGQEVWSRMNGAIMRDIALSAGGAYVPAGTALVDMGRVYDERIEPLARRDFESAVVRRYTPRFQWFVGAAFMLLLFESLLGQRRSGPTEMLAWEAGA